MVDALNGFDVDVDHLDGHKVHVHREKITWPGAKIKKANEGMPNYEDNLRKGTLFITFDVNFPKGELSTEEKEGNYIFIKLFLSLPSCNFKINLIKMTINTFLIFHDFVYFFLENQSINFSRESQATRF